MPISFIPEIWSAQVLESLKKTQVYTQAGIVNRDYEGEISGAGDTVKIRSVGRPTVASYTRNSTITYETLTDAQRSLVIDQSYKFSFSVDDLDKAQAAGNSMEAALTEASYSLKDTADQFIAGKYTDAQSANQLGTVSVTSTDLAYTQIRKLSVLLDQANVPSDGRYVIVPPWYYGLLLENDKFVRFDASGTTAGLRNGIVGQVLGFDVLKSNNAVLVTGDDYAVMAGYPGAISYAEQIVLLEAFRLQATIGDGVRGLHVYGGKVVRPDGIATVIASIT